MVTVDVNLGLGSYEIKIGTGVWQSVARFAADFDKVVLITDERVNRLYGQHFEFPRIVTAPGEGAKSWDNVQRVIEEMVTLGLTRNSLVIALGGGVVGDLAGFCAAIYMRGIPHIQLPTTLLAQVDSAIGGKTAIDLPGGKNLVGAFHQPKVVLTDPTALQTLSRRDIISGLGEVIKYAVIADPELVELVKQQGEAVFNSPQTALIEIIARCAKIKAAYVGDDQLDRGLRKHLNAGHTIGHALESASNFRAFSHGEAVLLGLMAEARLAYRLGILSRRGLNGIEEACSLYGLPEIPECLSRDDIRQSLTRDKKNVGTKISFILPKAMGEVEEVYLSGEEVEQHLEAILTPRPAERDLHALRRQINACDTVIFQALEERLQLIDEVAQYKRKHAVPIYVPEREAEILDRYAGDMKRLFTEVLKISRGRQSRTIFPFNIALIGFMGTGKSTVGPLLAHALGRKFIDLDKEIERREGCFIHEIFASRGEAGFRALETKLIAELGHEEDLVIACGGGAVLTESNREALRAGSKLVRLTASPQTVLERVGKLGDRPLLGGSPTYAAVAELMTQREPIYVEAADLTVDTDGLSPQDVCERIMTGLLEICRNQP